VGDRDGSHKGISRRRDLGRLVTDQEFAAHSIQLRLNPALPPPLDLLVRDPMLAVHPRSPSVAVTDDDATSRATSSYCTTLCKTVKKRGFV
jgi:hypothetical protein